MSALAHSRVTTARSSNFVLQQTVCGLVAALLAAAPRPGWSADLDLDRPVTFNIPSQSIESALIAFSKQAHIQLIIAPDINDGPAVPALSGTVRARTALATLLRNTGLGYAAVGSTVAIRRSSQVSDGTSQWALAAAPGSATNGDASAESPARNGLGSGSGSDNNRHEPGGLDQVIVTAQKRDERVQDVPMSLTALGGDELQRSQSYRFEDFVGKVPGLTLIDYGALGSQLVIRGITSGSVAVNSSVATYVDETPYTVEGPSAGSFLAAPNLDAFDMQRIEVLRGPQGTLYGANALGGLLKYVTNVPDPSAFSARVQTGLSTVADGGLGYDEHAMVNLPLGSNTALRLVGYDNYYPGFIDDPATGRTDINGAHFTGGRASLLFRPESDFSVRFNALYQDRSWGDYGNEDVHPGTLQPIYGSLIQEQLIGQPGHTTTEVYNVTLDWDAGFAKLLSTSSYYKYNVDALYNYESLDGFVSSVLKQPTGVSVDFKLPLDAFTQEVRLASHDDTRLRWQIGGYFTNENANFLQSVFPVNVTTRAVQFANATLGAFNQPLHYREYAAFADLDYQVAPTFDVDLGGRYSDNHQSFHEIGTGLFGGHKNFVTTSSQGVFTYSGDLRWRFTPDYMLYGRVAEGFVPGGPNIAVPGSTLPNSYASSTTVNYEAGLKGSLLDNHASFAVDAFLVTWHDIQLDATINGIGTIANGGTAKSEGAEWTFTYTPIGGLTLDLNGAYTDAYLTRATPASVNGHVGDRLPSVPLWGTSAGAEYRRPVFSGYSVFAGVDWRFTGSRFSDFTAAGPRQNLPHYNIFDLRSGLDTQRWSFAFYIKNVGNTIAINYVQPETLQGGNGAQSATVYTPRTIGGTVAVNF